MFLDYNSLDDYLHALQGQRDMLWAADRDDEADRLQDTLDHFQWAIGSVRTGTKLKPDDAQKLSRIVTGLTSPSDIQRLVPFHRWNAVYQATMKLADLLQRGAQGKPVRRFLGMTF